MHSNLFGCLLTILLMALLTTASTNRPQPPYFTGTKLNPSTFRIVQQDIYDEIPFIYAKLYPSTIVLIDTGCGVPVGAPASDALKAFIETAPIPDNENRPINPAGAKAYTVISTHCHFDHIGGMTEFADEPSTTIWAGAHNKCFLSPRMLPKNSYCVEVGMKTPSYSVTNWAYDGTRVTDREGRDLNLTVYFTPGHTPDSISIWDEAERWLFVGDTLYEEAPIYFQLGGSLFEYRDSLRKLRGLVDGWNGGDGHGGRPRVRIAAGHLTSGVDAAGFIGEMQDFFDLVVAGKIPAQDLPDDMRRYVSEDGKLGFEGYSHLFDEFLKG